MRTIPSFVHGPEEDGIGDNPVENLRIWVYSFQTFKGPRLAYQLS